jgi:CRP-like cAMP-binding protein
MCRLKTPSTSISGEAAVQLEDQSWATEEVIPLLRNVSFFGGLSDEDLSQVAAIVKKVSVKEDEVLFREGDPGDAFFIVHDGGVELTVARPSGQVEKLALRRAGEAFGEMALLNDAPRSATARAPNASSLIRIDKDAFQELLGRNQLAFGILASLSKALRALDMRLTAQDRLDAAQAGGGVDVREMSRLLQRGLIPEEAPRIQGFDIAAGTNLEDEGEGRTTWDFASLKDGRTALINLNVQGQGLPPGHYLAMARSLLRELALDHRDLQGLLARVNSGLASAVVEGMEQYVEAGILLPGDGAVEWAGAGRCPGAIIRRSGVFEEFSTHGPPLGMMEGFLYGTQRMELGAGDAVIVLSEAPQGIFRGAADLVASLQGKPVGEIVSTVHKALKKAQPDATTETSVLFIRRQ